MPSAVNLEQRSGSADALVRKAVTPLSIREGSGLVRSLPPLRLARLNAIQPPSNERLISRKIEEKRGEEQSQRSKAECAYVVR